MNLWLADNLDAQPALGAHGMKALLATAEALVELYEAQGWPRPGQAGFDGRLLNHLSRFYVDGYTRGMGTDDERRRGDDERRRGIAECLVTTLRARATPAQVEVLDGLFHALQRVVEERADDAPDA